MGLKVFHTQGRRTETNATCTARTLTGVFVIVVVRYLVNSCHIDIYFVNLQGSESIFSEKLRRAQFITRLAAAGLETLQLAIALFGVCG